MLVIACMIVALALWHRKRIVSCFLEDLQRRDRAPTLRGGIPKETIFVCLASLDRIGPFRHLRANFPFVSARADHPIG